MAKYPEGFTLEDYDELKAVLLEVGAKGSFDANDLLAAYMERSSSLVNAGSVGRILEELEGHGQVRRIPQGGARPPRWELL